MSILQFAPPVREILAALIVASAGVRHNPRDDNRVVRLLI
jgi:hypothetical protein